MPPDFAAINDNVEILIKREPLVYTRARRAVQKKTTKGLFSQLILWSIYIYMHLAQRIESVPERALCSQVGSV